MNIKPNARVETVTAEIISIDSNKNSIVIKHLNKHCTVQLNNAFLDSFNQIKAIFNASLKY